MVVAALAYSRDCTPDTLHVLGGLQAGTTPSRTHPLLGLGVTAPLQQTPTREFLLCCAGCQKQFPWPPPGFVGITASPEPPPSFTDTERLAFQALASAFDKCAGKCLLGPEAAQQCILLELQARTGIQAIAVPSDVLQWMATVCAMCAQPLTATQPSPSTRSITIKECVRYCSRACETVSSRHTIIWMTLDTLQALLLSPL